MIKFNGGLRVVQSLKSKKENEYIVVGEKIKDRIIINYRGYLILKKIFKFRRDERKLNELKEKYKEYIDELINLEILIDNNKVEEESLVYICNSIPKLPLSCLNLEITDGCNLKCIHCYNDFGGHKISFLDIKKLKELENEINLLNTYAIALTGGECTIHPNFNDFVDFFVKRGFEITIFTNGQNVESICYILQKYSYKEFTIKISFDGFEKEHNKIRGRNNSYQNVTNLLERLKHFPNAKVKISTVAMKINIDSLDSFKKMVKENYPNFQHSIDIVIPSIFNKEICFSEDEFDSLSKKAPFLFDEPKKSNHEKFRCSGGITQATLCTNGKLKICNGACSKNFEFQHNVFDVGLLKTWKNCGKNIKMFRHEKWQNTAKCKKCIYSKKCKITNCRIVAQAYKNNYNDCNPISCFITRRNEK